MPMHREVLPQLCTGLDWHCAFLYYETITMGLLRNRSGHLSMAERSASPLGKGGVPTQMKIARP